MYQRYFGPGPRSKYALACKAGVFGLAGTVVVFFSLLYNLYAEGEMQWFYCNLGTFVLFVALWSALIAVTKRELMFSVGKTNYLLFLSFLILAHSLMCGVKLYLAFQPALFSVELLGILLYLFLHLLASVLLLVNGVQSSRELSSRYTRLYRKVKWKRNLYCLAGFLLGLLLGNWIVIVG